jgi:hypothetical protein
VMVGSAVALASAAVIEHEGMIKVGISVMPLAHSTQDLI